MEFKVLGIIILCAVSGYILHNLGYKGVPVLILIAFVGVIRVCSSQLEEVFSAIGAFDSGGAGEEILSTLMKLLGVGYIFGICSEVCTELSQPLLARGADILCKIEMITIILPYLSDCYKLASEMIV